MNPNILLAAESFTSGNGGIARVARLMAKVIAEQVDAGRLQAQAVAFRERLPITDCHLSVWPSRGSQLRFYLKVQRCAWRCSHFVYDFLGMARAHPRIPVFNRPSMCYIHGLEVWENAPSIRIQTAARMDFLIANTAYTRMRAERIHRGFARAKICWLATETDDPAPAIDRRNCSPTVMILARVDECSYKGHLELIACWPTVVAAVPQAKLMIVGGGPGVPRLKQEVSSSPVAPHIEFHGYATDSVLAELWSKAAVFAMPSRGEGFGLVYIEAMRLGLPVVASVHDAAQEINLEGETGYNVNLDKPIDLADRIVFLLRNRDHAAVLGQNGQRHWYKHFRYSSFRSRFLPHLHGYLNL